MESKKIYGFMQEIYAEFLKDNYKDYWEENGRTNRLRIYERLRFVANILVNLMCLVFDIVIVMVAFNLFLRLLDGSYYQDNFAQTFAAATDHEYIHRQLTYFIKNMMTVAFLTIASLSYLFQAFKSSSLLINPFLLIKTVLQGLPCVVIIILWLVDINNDSIIHVFLCALILYGFIKTILNVFISRVDIMSAYADGRVINIKLSPCNYQE